YDFERYGADAVVELLLEILDIIELHELDARDDGRKGIAILRLAGGRHCTVSPAVERILHRQHAPLRFRSGTRGLLCVCARDLERSFESFRTAVREEDAIETRNASEPLRDLCRELVVVEVRRVNQLRR